MTDEERDIAACLLIEKAERNFEQAQKNADMGYWDLVANRLYYSVFHAVNALMLMDGIHTGMHKGTSAMFGKHYVLTGKFSREEGILYSRLQTMRERADYQNTFSFPEETGLKLISNTEQLLNRIKEVCKNRIDR